jgi:hypothetical protein
LKTDQRDTAVSSHKAVPDQLSVVFKKPMTAQGLKDYIISNGLHRYMIDGNRSGCLYWCYNVVACLERDGYVDRGSAAKVRELAAIVRAYGNFWVPEDRGSFYSA